LTFPEGKNHAGATPLSLLGTGSAGGKRTAGVAFLLKKRQGAADM